MNGTKKNQKTTLYRIYGANKRLLYIGISDNFENRMNNHSEKFWWREVRNIETVSFATRESASNAEIEAIRSESPKYNKVENKAKLAHKDIPKFPSAQIQNLVNLNIAADYLGVSQRTVRRLVVAGEITAYRLGVNGRLLRVDLNEIALFPTRVKSMKDYK